MSIARDELKEFAENSALKDVRTLNLLVIDMLSTEQLKQIENYFEKSLSLKTKPAPKKKEPEPKRNEQPKKRLTPEPRTLVRQPKRDDIDEDVFKANEDESDEEDDLDDLDEFEFDSDVAPTEINQDSNEAFRL